MDLDVQDMVEQEQLTAKLISQTTVKPMQTSKVFLLGCLRPFRRVQSIEVHIPSTYHVLNSYLFFHSVRGQIIQVNLMENNEN